MPDIGQIKGTNIKRGNSGLDPKTFDVVKEILDATTIITRQDAETHGKAGRADGQGSRAGRTDSAEAGGPRVS